MIQTTLSISALFLRHARHGLLAVAAVLAAGCALPGFAIDPPSFTLVDMRPLAGGAFEQRLELDLLVQNPNNFDVAIDGMRLQLDLNGQRLGRAVSNEPLTVARLDEARVTVQASITLWDVARQLLALEGRKSVDYRLSGDVFVAGPRSRRVSFDSSGEVIPTGTFN
jgi:LEA14-like dessication related protein